MMSLAPTASTRESENVIVSIKQGKVIQVYRQFQNAFGPGTVANYWNASDRHTVFLQPSTKLFITKTVTYEALDGQGQVSDHQIR